MPGRAIEQSGALAIDPIHPAIGDGSGNRECSQQQTATESDRSHVPDGTPSRSWASTTALAAVIPYRYGRFLEIQHLRQD
jgi:hypothetical protein